MIAAAASATKAIISGRRKSRRQGKELKSGGSVDDDPVGGRAASVGAEAGGAVEARPNQASNFMFGVPACALASRALGGEHGATTNT